MPRTLELAGILGTLPDILDQATEHKLLKIYAPPNPEPVKMFQFAERREPTPSVPHVCCYSYWLDLPLNEDILILLGQFCRSLATTS